MPHKLVLHGPELPNTGKDLGEVNGIPAAHEIAMRHITDDKQHIEVFEDDQRISILLKRDGKIVPQGVAT